MSPIHIIVVTLALMLSAPFGAPVGAGAGDGISAAAGSESLSVALDPTTPDPGLPGTRPRQSADDDPNPAIEATADQLRPRHGATVDERAGRDHLAAAQRFLIPFETGPPRA